MSRHPSMAYADAPKLLAFEFLAAGWQEQVVAANEIEAIRFVSVFCRPPGTSVVCYWYVKGDYLYRCEFNPVWVRTGGLDQALLDNAINAR